MRKDKEVFMNKQESDILRTLFMEPFINQRILSETSGHSLGVVNRSIKALINAGYLSEDIRPTEKAKYEYSAKAPKNAIILAAGYGMRMVPINLSTPKGLLEVNGEPLIERTIKELHEVGVADITIVVGHLKEPFYQWAKEWKGVELIENPFYDVCNNIGSLYTAREHLEDCIILDGDQIIYNSSILDPHFTLSGYNAVWCEGETNEWLMTVENGIVQSCSRTGGVHGWQLYSVSRWSTEDGRKLKKHLEYEFDRGNRDIYWDDVAMSCHFEDYTLGIREMRSEDIIEIDSLDELAAIDHSYEAYGTNTENKGAKDNVTLH